ncbi:MAG: DNA polymerase III, subunit gamma and tau [Hydrogenophilaceae bacterium CG1_02_62_390]|nr:MAG: DNA polymerase III, subunit gamma and tau [Hydrogenophilaceae bacterium CG1_02_62_390]
MSYQVLARKWRPKSFAELIGQEHVVRALSNALEQGRLHHAYLFTGTRGVGKTTLARILARCLNCEAGVSAKPCGICPACQQIEAGRFVDLIEIDAASYTGVDNMREVLENAQYAPTAGRYKVYIIDEVHMLSKNAFNAMLKTLEEPPAHVVFVLATTDPQKVPVTVLSRCLQFNLKQMPPGQVANHLRTVLDGEGIAYEPGALNLLARAAAGSMRDALSLTDQAIAYGSGEVHEQPTRDMLGTVDQAYLLPLLEALADADGPRLMREAEAIAERSLSFDAALQDLALLLQQMALAQTVPDAVADDVPERARLCALAERTGPETVQLYYQIATLGRRDLELAPDEYAGFTMTLLRMLAFAPAGEIRFAAAKPKVVGASAPIGSVQIAAKAAPAIATVAAFDGDWFALSRRLTGGVKQLAALCEMADHGANFLKLRLPADQKSLLDSLGEKLKAALRKLLSPAVRIEFELGATSGAAPAEIVGRQQAARQAEAEASVMNDPFVQTMVRDFDATVTNIKPIGEPAP